MSYDAKIANVPTNYKVALAVPKQFTNLLQGSLREQTHAFAINIVKSELKAWAGRVIKTTKSAIFMNLQQSILPRSNVSVFQPFVFLLQEKLADATTYKQEEVLQTKDFPLAYETA